MSNAQEDSGGGGGGGGVSPDYNFRYIFTFGVNTVQLRLKQLTVVITSFLTLPRPVVYT